MSHQEIKELLNQIHNMVEQVTMKIDNNEDVELAPLQQLVGKFCQLVNDADGAEEIANYDNYIRSIKESFKIWVEKLKTKQASLKNEIETFDKNAKGNKAYVNASFVSANED
jgi:hypothetical protein